MSKREAVLTGLGVLAPVGIDKDTFWNALLEQKSGVGFLNIETADENLRPMGSEVPEFHAKDYVKPRKNIKVMSRDIQLAFVSACLACRDAGLVTEEEGRNVDPDRFGVVFGSDLIGAEIDMQLDTYRAGIETDRTGRGTYNFSRWGTDAMEKIFPLWMLKFLPNMPACQICIGLDARGPSNSITLCRGSSLAAIIEAVRTIETGRADVMIGGGCGNRANQDFQTRAKSYFSVAPRQMDPCRVPRPFDADRCGRVMGEGSGAFVLESREHAEARGAKIYAAVKGFAETNEPAFAGGQWAVSDGSLEPQGGCLPFGAAIRRSMELALKRADLKPADIGLVNPDGLGSAYDDRIEAESIRAVLGDVPVSATKGNFGDLGSGTGAVELAAAVLALETGVIPPTRNHDTTAADCPINVVHGKSQPLKSSAILKMNQTRQGRAFAVVLTK